MKEVIVLNNNNDIWNYVKEGIDVGLQEFLFIE